MQVRAIVEIGCVELAAQYRSVENLQELNNMLGQMEDAVENEEMSQLYDANFHLAIAKATQNPYLQTMMEGLSESLHGTMQVSRRLWLEQGTQSLRQLFEEHREIYLAIARQDVHKASLSMKKHLDQVMKALQK